MRKSKIQWTPVKCLPPYFRTFEHSQWNSKPPDFWKKRTELLLNSDANFENAHHELKEKSSLGCCVPASPDFVNFLKNSKNLNKNITSQRHQSGLLTITTRKSPFHSAVAKKMKPILFRLLSLQFYIIRQKKTFMSLDKLEILKIKIRCFYKFLQFSFKIRLI